MCETTTNSLKCFGSWLVYCNFSYFILKFLGFCWSIKSTVFILPAQVTRIYVRGGGGGTDQNWEKLFFFCNSVSPVKKLGYLCVGGGTE